MPQQAAVAIRAVVAWIGGGLVLTLVFASTLFLSALLLFAVQPLFARMVLPHLGGTPAVWSVALVFFQGALLAGYAYAHVLVRLAGVRRALLIHLGLLAAALLWLPIEMARGFGELPETGVAVWLIGLFAASVGIPFFAVSANAPLLQAWFSRTGHRDAGDPYFLYGASNLGSFAALLAYPVLIEPAFGLARQAELWAAGFLVVMAGIVLCGLLAAHRSQAPAPATVPPVARPAAGARGWTLRLSWIALAFVPSALLVAVTAHISTNLAAAPLLWVMPLALFLLTFVLTFRRRPLVTGGIVVLAAPPVVFAGLAEMLMPSWLGLLPGILVQLLAFFVAAFICHMELVARRPAAERLTEFYFLMSLGGVLGGAFSSLVAPAVFNSIVEYPILLAVSLFAIPQLRAPFARPLWRYGYTSVALAALILTTWRPDVEWRERSFFGVLRIDRSADGEFRRLVHGTTVHGGQRLSDYRAGRRPEPLSYYTAEGPIASAIRIYRHSRGRPLSVGVVGLGTGSLACYAEPGETWRFFEIDPAVARIARDPTWFTFLSHCLPAADIVLGDARQKLMQEQPGSFDVIVVDAFSSDAIPVHLMTRESLALFADKLAPDGLLVMHISNRYMELASVVAATAAAEGLHGVSLQHDRPEEEVRQLRLASSVAGLARERPAVVALHEAGWRDLSQSLRADVAPWTDDYSNVLAAILRKEGLISR